MENSIKRVSIYCSSTPAWCRAGPDWITRHQICLLIVLSVVSTMHQIRTQSVSRPAQHTSRHTVHTQHQNTAFLLQQENTENAVRTPVLAQSVRLVCAAWTGASPLSIETIIRPNGRDRPHETGAAALAWLGGDRGFIPFKEHYSQFNPVCPFVRCRAVQGLGGRGAPISSGAFLLEIVFSRISSFIFI